MFFVALMSTFFSAMSLYNYVKNDSAFGAAMALFLAVFSITTAIYAAADQISNAANKAKH